MTSMTLFYRKMCLFAFPAIFMISCITLNIGTESPEDFKGVIVDFEWRSESVEMLVVSHQGTVPGEPSNSYLYSYDVSEAKSELMEEYPKIEINDIDIYGGDTLIGYLQEPHLSSESSGIFIIKPEKKFLAKGNGVTINDADGTLIVFGYENFKFDLFIMDIDGNKVSDILHIENKFYHNIHAAGIDNKNGMISFTANLDQIGEQIKYIVYLYSTKDEKLGNILTDGYNSSPSFSPDGRYISYCAGKESYNQVLTVYDLSNQQTKSYESYECDGVSWSPDGKTIAIIQEFNRLFFIDTSILFVHNDSDSLSGNMLLSEPDKRMRIP